MRDALAADAQGAQTARVIVAVSTVGYVVLVVFGLIVVLGLFEAVRLFVRLMRGDEQIEGTSWGSQFIGRRRDKSQGPLQ